MQPASQKVCWIQFWLAIVLYLRPTDQEANSNNEYRVCFVAHPSNVRSELFVLFFCNPYIQHSFELLDRLSWWVENGSHRKLKLLSSPHQSLAATTRPVISTDTLTCVYEPNCDPASPLPQLTIYWNIFCKPTIASCSSA